jgi:hypothetical protein
LACGDPVENIDRLCSPRIPHPAADAATLPFGRDKAQAAKDFNPSP